MRLALQSIVTFEAHRVWAFVTKSAMEQYVGNGVAD